MKQNPTHIFAIHADITTLKVDAIVNAANRSLLGGGGVDGAIHAVAGQALLEECRTLGGCQTGEAKLTKGYGLPAAYIIHTVRPVWRGGYAGEAELLSSCYRQCLGIASEQHFSSLAFPCIGTGIYGFPADRAADIAVAEVIDFTAKTSSQLQEIIFCCFSQTDLDLYLARLA